MANFTYSHTHTDTHSQNIHTRKHTSIKEKSFHSAVLQFTKYYE